MVITKANGGHATSTSTSSRPRSRSRSLTTPVVRARGAGEERQVETEPLAEARSLPVEDETTKLGMVNRQAQRTRSQHHRDDLLDEPKRIRAAFKLAKAHVCPPVLGELVELSKRRLEQDASASKRGPREFIPVPGAGAVVATLAEGAASGTALLDPTPTHLSFFVAG
jgi:hypothetical protein